MNLFIFYAETDNQSNQNIRSNQSNRNNQNIQSNQSTLTFLNNQITQHIP